VFHFGFPKFVEFLRGVGFPEFCDLSLWSIGSEKLYLYR
jgi:hypothetical protein